jgi:hypothetical protein
MMTWKKIEIFKVGSFRSTLLEDLTVTAPANLHVIGCEYGGDNRITSTLSIWPPPFAPMRRDVMQPPRGEFDLWQHRPDVMIVYKFPAISHVLNAAPYDREGDRPHTALVPVRSTGQDLAAARGMATSTIFSCPRSAFVLLNSDEPDRQFVDELASIGPVAPAQFSFRETPLWKPLPPGPVTISDLARAEGEAMWKWLIDFIDIPSS